MNNALAAHGVMTWREWLMLRIANRLGLDTVVTSQRSGGV
jgi:hypothetical protein